MMRRLLIVLVAVFSLACFSDFVRAQDSTSTAPPAGTMPMKKATRHHKRAAHKRRRARKHKKAAGMETTQPDTTTH